MVVSGCLFAHWPRNLTQNITLTQLRPLARVDKFCVDETRLGHHHVAMRLANSDECPFVRIALLLTHTSLTPEFQEHDTFAALLTSGLCVGLVLSYLPQVRSVHPWT